MPRMYHDYPKMTGGPTTADVPEEAVSWMQKCGWYLKNDPDKTKSEKPQMIITKQDGVTSPNSRK